MAPTHLLVTRVGPCSEASEVVTVSEMSLSTQTYDSMLNGEFNISENLDNGWKIKATMQKCVDIRNRDTCDLFRSYFLVRNGCSEDDDDEDTYGMLFRHADPRLACPVEAGRYKIEDYPLFTEANYLAVQEAKISTSVFGYTFRLDGFNVDFKKVFCVEAHLQLLYMRDHDWHKSTHIQETTVRPSTKHEIDEEP